MSFVLQELRKDLARLNSEIKALEKEKDEKRATNPWYPVQELSAKIGHAKRKYRIQKEKLEGLIHV